MSNVRNEWETVCKFSKELKESNDCAVKAVSIVTGVHYHDVHSLMMVKGRKHRGTTKQVYTYQVLRQLGAQLTVVPFRSKTIRTLEREFKHRPGTYLVWVRGHLFAMKDGEVLDWTKGRRHRIINVQKVEHRYERAAASNPD